MFNLEFLLLFKSKWHKQLESPKVFFSALADTKPSRIHKIYFCLEFSFLGRR